MVGPRARAALLLLDAVTTPPSTHNASFVSYRWSSKLRKPALEKKLRAATLSDCVSIRQMRAPSSFMAASKACSSRLPTPRPCVLVETASHTR